MPLGYNIEVLIYLVSLLITLSLGFFVFFRGRGQEINRTFFLSILFASGWLITLFLFYNLESAESVLFVGRLNFAVVLPLLYYLLRFSIAFPKRKTKTSPIVLKFIGLWVALSSLLTLFTPLVGKDEIILGPRLRETVYGPLYPLYIAHYAVFAAAIIFFLAVKLRRSVGVEKYQIIYVLLGLFLALLFGFITNIVLPLFGLFAAQNYGPLATVIFSIFVVFAIFKHHLFNIKVIATELFTGLLLIILLINTFLSQGISQLALNLSIFIGALIVGILLIRSVLQEVKTRERLEKLTLELEKANIELKKADRAKTEFLSMASHQLRTPLTAIKGYISLYLEGFYDKNPQKAKETMGKVAASIERLIKIVNDLLTITRVEMGKLVAEKSPTQIIDLLEDIVDEFKARVEEKGLYLVLEKPQTPLPKINIDTLKIRQAIINLLDNAIRYTPTGGITIRVGVFESFLRVEIKDTGEGLEPEEIDSLFESFKRGKTGINFFVEGTGLGLHIAKRFVELHQGRILARSEGKGKGSTFVIELPVS